MWEVRRPFSVRLRERWITFLCTCLVRMLLRYVLSISNVPMVLSPAVIRTPKAQCENTPVLMCSWKSWMCHRRNNHVILVCMCATRSGRNAVSWQRAFLLRAVLRALRRRLIPCSARVKRGYSTLKLLIREQQAVETWRQVYDLKFDGEKIRTIYQLIVNAAHYLAPVIWRPAVLSVYRNSSAVYRKF